MAFKKTVKTKSGTYIIEVEGYRDKEGKVKHRYLRSLGKLDENGELIPRMNIQNVEAQRVKLHGPVLALHAVTQDVNLEHILGDYAAEICALVYSHILRPESLNNIKRALKWIDTDEIGLQVPVSRKRFEHALDELESRIQSIEKELYEKISEHCTVETLFYDVTSIYFYGIKVKRAKHGYGNHLPHIGIGLAVESQYGIPVFHYLFDGNVYDAKTFPIILERLQEFNRKKCTLIFDRGITSKKNIVHAIDLGVSVIACIALRGKTVKEMALSTVKKMGPQNICQLSSVFVHAKEIETEWGGIPLRMIICIDKPLREKIQQNRYYELKDALEKLKNKSTIKNGLKKYIKMGKNPEINYKAVAEAEKLDGVYAIVTNTDIPTEKVVQKYFDRDMIEKSFSALKGTICIQPVRHWLWRRVKAHIFICYLAYLHLAWMKMLLTKNGISLSPVKALQELETIYTVNLTDKKTHMSTTKTVPLTKEQEKIYKALNLLS